ncbi:hypothetical protein V1478_013767, partial [Vespula squamosa]
YEDYTLSTCLIIAEEKGGNISKRKEEERSLTILETGLDSTRLNSDSRFARYLRYFFERESSSPEVLPSDLRVPSAAKFMPSLRSTSMSGRKTIGKVFPETFNRTMRNPSSVTTDEKDNDVIEEIKIKSKGWILNELTKTLDNTTQ